MKRICLIVILALLNGCTLPPLGGHIAFPDFDKTYTFEFSKEKLKDNLVGSYSYDVGVFSKKFGKILIENPEVNKKYRPSMTDWLDKSNWDNYKDEIRSSLGDTVNIRLVKWNSRKSICFKLILDGDEHQSTLRIINVTAERRQEFSKSKGVYKDKISRRIEAKFIKKLQ